MAIGETIAEIWRFFDFSKMDLGFVMRMCRSPAKSIWWSLSLCKIWLESSSFDNMQVLIFCKFGLKTPIHIPKIGFWGQNRGRGGAMLTPNEVVLTFGIVTSVPLLVKIDQEMRP